MLLTPQEASNLIEIGRHLAVAGDEGLLSKLPKGSWMGGTTPYFMAQDGCTVDKDKLFVHDLTDVVLGSAIRSYGVDDLPKLSQDAPDHGFSIVVIPLASPALFAYGRNAPNYPGFFMKPIVGWVSGTHQCDFGRVSPKTFNGLTGEISDKNVVAIHCPVAQGKTAVVKMLNLFRQGHGEAIVFEEDGFRAKECLINGKRRSFAEYLKENQIDTRLPLVANHCGAIVNVSFQSVDEVNGVALYAPVFKGVDYRIAAPVSSYIDDFKKSLPLDASPVFACNCFLTFLYSELEGQVVEKMCGPITFGEIAYHLLNQTMVYLEVH
jgi:hypothetical protein